MKYYGVLRRGCERGIEAANAVAATGAECQPSAADFPATESPVDVDGEIGWRFPAEILGTSASPAGNPLVPCEILR